MTDLADIHDIVEHLRKHTLGGEHDEEQVVDALVRVMDRRPDLRKLLKPADVAYLRAKKGGKGRYAFEESQHPRGQPENAGEFATNPGGGAKKLSNEHKVGERSAKFAVKLAKRNGTPLEPIVLERLSEQLKGHPQERELLEQVRAVTQGQEPAQQAPAATTPSKVELEKIASIGMSLDKPDSPALNTPQAVAADKAIREAIGGQAMLTYPGKGFVQIGNDEFMAVVSVHDVGGRGEVGTYIPVITPRNDDGHWQVGQTGISGGRAYRLPADAKPEEIAMAVRANMPRKENGKLQITRDESFHLEELARKLREARKQRRAAHYARDWNDLRAAGRNVTRDEITAAASDLAGTGVYVAWNASDDAPGWEAVPASVVDAVMGRYARDGEPGGGVMFGGEVHTGDDEQERIHLIADILHGVYGDDVMSMFDDKGQYGRDPDGRYAKWGPEEAAQHPRGPNGQFVKRGTGEAATATREKVRDALKGGGTAKELAGHLDLLTVKQLSEIKKEYQISASGRNKAELVAKLAERLSKGRGDGEKPEGESPSYAEWGKGERESRTETVEPAEPEAVKEPHEMTAKEWHESKVPDHVAASRATLQAAKDKLADAHAALERNKGSVDRQRYVSDVNQAGKEVEREQANLSATESQIESRKPFWERKHREAILDALASGKPVPNAVLADYPDLAAKYGKGEQPAKPAAEKPETQTRHSTKEELKASLDKVASSQNNRYAVKMEQQWSRLAPKDGREVLHEYRSNGYVTRSDDGKYTLHTVAGTDGKEWRIADKIDITDQYAKPTASKPIHEKLKEVFQGEPTQPEAVAAKPSESGTPTMTAADYRASIGLPRNGIGLDHSIISPNGRVSDRTRQGTQNKQSETMRALTQSDKDYENKVLSGAIIEPGGGTIRARLSEIDSSIPTIEGQIRFYEHLGMGARGKIKPKYQKVIDEFKDRISALQAERERISSLGKEAKPAAPTAPKQADPSTHSPKIAASFDKLNSNGRNFVSIAKLRAEHPELSKDEFDKAVFHMRKEGGFTASALEGRDGASKEELAGATNEGGEKFGYLSRREGWKKPGQSENNPSTPVDKPPQSSTIVDSSDKPKTQGEGGKMTTHPLGHFESPESTQKWMEGKSEQELRGALDGVVGRMNRLKESRFGQSDVGFGRLLELEYTAKQIGNEIKKMIAAKGKG